MALADRYRIEEELGRGGWGVVFAAEELASGKQVAIKLLQAEMVSATGRKRFLQEIDLARRLKHPGILPMLDSGEAAGTMFFVMPLVTGESLQGRLLREHQLPVPEALRITREVAEALGYAHAAGIVHRDIKPANILLGADRAVVADFGIARALNKSVTAESISTSGTHVGTAAYMSPEQAAGVRELDGRSDLYSLGCVLYEMLGGGPPFTGPTAQSMMARHAIDSVPPLRTVRPAVPVSLEEVVYRMLAKSPADRFRDTQGFVAALDLVARDPLVSVAGYGRRWWRRKRMLAVAAGAIIVASVVGGREAVRAADVRAVAAADTTRLVLFPFNREGSALTGFDPDQSLRRAVLRWRGVELPDASVVRDANGGATTAPSSTANARQAALRLNAGRFVLGRLGGVTDGRALISVTLHDVSQPSSPLAERSAVVRTGAIDSAMVRLADAVLLRPRDSTMAASPRDETGSLPAWQAYARGQDALSRWELDAADSAFDSAYRFDKQFTRAALWLALARTWKNEPAATWGYVLESAQPGRERLGQPERLMLDALAALAVADRPLACARWDSLTKSAPGDYAAWYGSADCIAKDRVVIAEPRSPTGWRFRSSSQDAIRRYRRAFGLRPALLGALRNDGFERVRRMLWTTGTDLRRGESTQPPVRRFAAIATLDHDTLAFVPALEDAVVAVDSASMRHLTLNVRAAVQAQRQVFRDLTTTWVRSNPSSAAAREALAVALALLGDAAALDTLAEAVRLARTPIDSVRALWSETWMRLEFAIPDDTVALARVRTLADALRHSTTLGAIDPHSAAAVAALTGHAFAAASIQRSVAAASFARTSVAPEVAPAASALLVFAAIGGPVDSLVSLERRIDSLIRASTGPDQRQRARMESLARPAILAFPVHALSAVADLGPGGPYLLGAEAGWIRKDTGAVLAAIASIQSARQRVSPLSTKMDALYPEAWLLAVAGRTDEAAEWIDAGLASLRSSGPLIDPVHAATLVRAMAFRAELAATRRDTATAARWARCVLALWSGGDAFLQPLIARMRVVASATPVPRR